jgi:hypothetical protein
MTGSMTPAGVPDAQGLPVPPGPAGVPVTPDATAGMTGAVRPTVTVATYTDYASAQRAVDYLSDQGFPVERTAIVGTNLRLVEKVLGRLTTARAAMAGAASGAWLGLLIGLLFGIFSVSSWWKVLVAAILIGAAWGAIFGAIAHGATGGRRDFTSRSMLQASEYGISVDAEFADNARQLLTRLNWQASGAS